MQGQSRLGLGLQKRRKKDLSPPPHSPQEAMHPGTTHHNLPQLSGCSQLFCLTSYPATTSHGVSKQAHGLCVEPAASGPMPPLPPALPSGPSLGSGSFCAPAPVSWTPGFSGASYSFLGRTQSSVLLTSFPYKVTAPPGLPQGSEARPSASKQDQDPSLLSPPRLCFLHSGTRSYFSLPPPHPVHPSP